MKRLFLFLWVSGLFFQTHALQLDRVILGCDANPEYLDFWPFVAKAWKKIVGITPTLILIADDTVQVDESLGDVIRLKPMGADIPTWFQAQTIRLLAPALFPNDVCITSDMDMIPLNKHFFVDSIRDVQEDAFVVYKSKAYGGNRFPMCYLAARGSVFKEIVQLESIENFPDKIKTWADFGLGWETDEIVLYQYVTRFWKGYKSRCVLLGYGDQGGTRIDRENWSINEEALRSGKYYDAHLLRPYKEKKQQLDKFFRMIGLL